MAHCANLVLVTANGWQLYTDKWASYTLDVDLLWGPEAAVSFIQAIPPSTVWYDDIWCEGAAVVDTVNKGQVPFYV